MILFSGLATSAMAQDVFVLGEVHDNHHHHQIQAEKVSEIQPKAIVFEMLTVDQAAGYDAALQSDQDALKEALQWAEHQWPDFAIYYPIFAAAGDADIYGAALPRDAARTAMSEGAAAVFPGDVALYQLDQPLPDEQQQTRLDMQFEAHCGALPRDMLHAMIDIKRLRDAMLAQATLKALKDTGGPVAVITGNGHARRDWGMPAALALVASDVEVYSLGQSEDDAEIDGGFDEVLSSPSVEREDPCAAFQ